MPKYQVTYTTENTTTSMYWTRPSITSVIDAVIKYEHGERDSKIISIELTLLEK